MRTSPLERRAEERARRRRRQRSRKRRSDLDRSGFEVARLRRQRRRAAKRRARRVQRKRRAAQRSTRLQRWRDRPGRTQRAEARLRRALRLNTLRQKLPALSWYRGLPERSRPRRWEVLALIAVVAATGAVMATAAKDLTGIGNVDVGWAVAAGIVVPLAGSRAARAVLLVAGAVAAVGVESWWGLAGVAALALSSGLVYRRRGRIVGLRVMHALSAALTLVALVHVPPMRGFPSGTTGTVASLALAALVIAAIVVSGWWNSAPRLRLVSGVAVAVGAVVVVGLTASLWLAVRDSQLGDDVALAAAGTQLSTTDLAGSLADLEAAGPGLTLLADRLETPLWQPLRAVPLVAQQYEALEATVGSALDLVALAGEGADLVNDPVLRPAPGGVDLAALETLEVPLGDLVGSLGSAGARLSTVDGPFLLPGVAGPVGDLRAAVSEALPPTELALDGVRAVASMLGADGPRTWLVQFVGAGGAELQLVTAVDGTLTPLGPPVDPTLGVSLGDLTTSPDYPAAAAAAADRLAAAGLGVDGIVTVDPEGAAAISAALGAPDAAGSAATLVAALTSSLLPAPGDLAAVVGTAAAERRILMWSAVPEEQSFMEAIDTAGSLRRNDGRVDLVYVGLTPDAGQSVGSLTRSITYRTTYDAGTGETTTRGDLVITNTATDGFPVTAQLTLLSGLELVSLEVNRISATPTPGELSGWNLWTLPIQVPTGGRLEVTWRLSGVFPTFDYTFAFQPQTLGGPVSLEWLFRWTVLESPPGDFIPLVRQSEAEGPLTFSPMF